jgi:acetylornithine deacetylase/succinyl-diaminopimelate desuccinylase-like protein
MDVVDICRDLIAIDTSNPGGTERPAAEYIARALTAAKIDFEVIEPVPGRTSIVSLMPGRDRSLPRLALHAHIDVVPADPAGWTHPPFRGDVDEGMVWGRGAVDMKDFAAMMLALQCDLRASDQIPRRDIDFVYLADEETGSRLGSQWIVHNRPDQLRGVYDSIAEV